MNRKLKPSSVHPFRPSAARKRRPTSGLQPPARSTAAQSSGTPLSEKLQALQSLIPEQASTGASEIHADKLLRETADYIVLLETRVSVLQGLIRFYEAVGGAAEDRCCS